MMQKLRKVWCMLRGYHLVDKEGSDGLTTIQWCKCGEVLWTVNAELTPSGTTTTK